MSGRSRWDLGPSDKPDEMGVVQEPPRSDNAPDVPTKIDKMEVAQEPPWRRSRWDLGPSDKPDEMGVVQGPPRSDKIDKMEVDQEPPRNGNAPGVPTTTGFSFASPFSVNVSGVPATTAFPFAPPLSSNASGIPPTPGFAFAPPRNGNAPDVPTTTGFSFASPFSVNASGFPATTASPFAPPLSNNAPGVSMTTGFSFAPPSSIPAWPGAAAPNQYYQTGAQYSFGTTQPTHQAQPAMQPYANSFQGYANSYPFSNPTWHRQGYTPPRPAPYSFGYPPANFGQQPYAQYATFGVQGYNLAGAHGNGEEKRMSAKKEKKEAAIPQNGGRRNRVKILVPGPRPLPDYFRQAFEETSIIDPPNRILVVLDLNGTIIFRRKPDNNPKNMVARHYLRPFLRYLFQNFLVMVWSSMKPDNVNALVSKVMNDDQGSLLVATWDRGNFGLTDAQYNANVQVYKDLTKIWNDEGIQRKHPEYDCGQRFNQYNTILLDDSIEKAIGQPHNLLQVPEFKGTAHEQVTDVLAQVAGYLEAIRMQSNVSSFMRQRPFKLGDGWFFDWTSLPGEK